MLPVVVMKWCEATSFDREMTHEKSRGPVLLVDEPFYPRSFRSFFRNRSICHRGHVYLMQS